jgi:hypothetical protein
MKLMTILFIGFVISTVALIVYPSTVTEIMIKLFSASLFVTVFVRTFRDLKSI